MASHLPYLIHFIDNVHRLKDVPDLQRMTPDGQTIEERIQNLCVDVAEDIKQCANTCDTYLKFVLLVFLFFPSLTAKQEEGTCQDIRRAKMGRQTFEVR